MSKTIDKSLTKKLMVQSLASAKSKFLSLSRGSGIVHRKVELYGNNGAGPDMLGGPK